MFLLSCHLLGRYKYVIAEGRGAYLHSLNPQQAGLFLHSTFEGVLQESIAETLEISRSA